VGANLPEVASTSSELSRAPGGAGDPTDVNAERRTEPDGIRGRNGAKRRVRTRASRARTVDLLIGAVIAACALVMYLPYDARASFLLDDYTMMEHFQFGTWLPTYRPTFKLEMDVANFFFGDSPRGYYLLLGVMAATIGVLLFASLRSLGLSVVPSAIAGTSIVVYPRADAVTLWWSSTSAMALCLGLGSVWLGSVWVRRSGRSPALLIPALALMAAAVLCYESIFPLFLLPLCLVPLSSRPRRLVGMAVLEGVTAGAAALYMYTAEAAARDAMPLSRYPARMWQLIVSGLHAYPFGGVSAPTAIGLGIAAGTLVAMVVAVGASGRSAILHEVEPLRRLLATVPLLALGAFVSLVPFIPAPAYYEPGGVGPANRVNALPQVFVVTAVAVTIWLVARMVIGWRSPMAAVALAAVAAVSMVGAFAGSVHQDQSGYLAAARYRSWMLHEMHQLLPSRPASGTVVFVGDYLQNEGPPANPAFPTIQNEWDTSATLQLMYGTMGITGWTVSPNTMCRPATLFSSLLGVTVDVPYRQATIVDIRRHRVYRFADAKECQADLPRLAEPS